MSSSFFQGLKNSMATPETKRAYNRGLFTRVAEEYDTATKLMSLGRDKSWKRALVNSLPMLPSPKCIDLACGTGDVTLLLRDKYPNGQIVGIDLTPSMLDVARRRCLLRDITFVEADMCRMQIPDGAADIVTGSYAIRNAPNLDEALSEIYRILKPGGIAAFLDFHKSANHLLALCSMTLLKWWCGLCGILVHGAPEHAYIAESLRKFPDGVELRSILANHGFDILHTRKFLFGITELLLIQKSDDFQLKLSGSNGKP